MVKVEKNNCCFELAFNLAKEDGLKKDKQIARLEANNRKYAKDLLKKER